MSSDGLAGCGGGGHSSGSDHSWATERASHLLMVSANRVPTSRWRLPVARGATWYWQSEDCSSTHCVSRLASLGSTPLTTLPVTDFCQQRLLRRSSTDFRDAGSYPVNGDEPSPDQASAGGYSQRAVAGYVTRLWYRRSPSCRRHRHRWPRGSGNHVAAVVRRTVGSILASTAPPPSVPCTSRKRFSCVPMATRFVATATEPVAHIFVRGERHGRPGEFCQPPVARTVPPQRELGRSNAECHHARSGQSWRYGFVGGWTASHRWATGSWCEIPHGWKTSVANGASTCRTLRRLQTYPTAIRHGGAERMRRRRAQRRAGGTDPRETSQMLEYEHGKPKCSRSSRRARMDPIVHVSSHAVSSHPGDAGADLPVAGGTDGYGQSKAQIEIYARGSGRRRTGEHHFYPWHGPRPAGGRSIR